MGDLTARGARQARMDSDLREAVMNLSLLSLRTTRWLRSTRWAATAAAAALCVPASSAQVVLGAGVPASRGAAVVDLTSGFSGGKWGDPTADTVSKDSYGKNQACLLYTSDAADDLTRVD